MNNDDLSGRADREALVPSLDDSFVVRPPERRKTWSPADRARRQAQEREWLARDCRCGCNGGETCAADTARVRQ
jgi:hypothetical protein